MKNKDTYLSLTKIQCDALLACNADEAMLLIAAMRDYCFCDKDNDIPVHLLPLWIIFKGEIDKQLQDRQDYIESKKNAGKASAAKRKQKQAISGQSNSNIENKPEEKDVDLFAGDDVFAPAPAPAPEPESVSGSESAPAPESAFNSKGVLTDYPQTVEEVIAISERIRSPMDRELAQRYFDQRSRADWHQGVGGTGRKIKPEHIPADIRLWIDREKAQNAQQSKSPPGKSARETRIALINGEMDEEDYDALMPTYNPPALAGILADLEKEKTEGKEKG